MFKTKGIWLQAPVILAVLGVTRYLYNALRNIITFWSNEVI